MKTRTFAMFAAAAGALVLANDAMAVLTLNGGSVTWSFTQPANATTTGGSANLTVGDGNTTDQLFQDQWYWRINGVSTRESNFFGGIEAGGGTPNGSVTYTNVDGAGMFNAVLNVSVSDPGNQMALVTSAMTITNTSTAGGSLNLSLFSYLDYDLGGSTSNSATWIDQPNNIMGISHVGGTTGQYQGVGANAFQVGAFASIRTLLTNAVIDNLNNTGLPFGPGDFTGAFQWDLNVAAGQSVTITTLRSINTPVPAPGALALLGIAGLVAGRRRRH